MKIKKENSLKTHSKKHEILSDLGFPVLKSHVCENISEVQKKYEELLKKRENLDFEIDGIVVLVNQIDLFQKLGIVGKGPRGGTAYKFPATQVSTILENITWQIGRTGKLTPVAELKPVKVAGTTVKRASLHSTDLIEKLDLKIKDRVIIQKAGDIIPEIVDVLPNFRTGIEKEIIFPENCPDCNEKLVQENIILMCENPDCPAKNLNRLIYFASKKCFDFENLGPKIIEKFYDLGFLKNFQDFFLLKNKKSEILNLEGFQEKSVNRILENIESKKKITIFRFLNSLGVSNLGEKSVFDLVDFILNSDFHDDFFEILFSLEIEDFIKIDGVAEKTAKTWKSYFSEKSHQDQILDLIKNHEIKIEFPEKKENLENQNSEYFKKIFVITGSFSIKREKIKQKLIQKFQAKISSSVSKNTDFLIAGEKAGKKLDQAKKLNISILDENFLKKLK